MKSYPTNLNFLVDQAWTRQGLSTSNPWEWWEGVTFEATQDGIIRAGGTAFSFAEDYGMFARKILPSEHDSNNVDSNFPSSEKPRDFGDGLVARRNSLTFDAIDGTDITSLGFYGTVPTLTGLTSVEEIDLSANTLTGSMSNITTGSSFRKLLLQNNKITGSIPSMSGCSDCREYNFSNNLISTYTSGNFASADEFLSIDLSNNIFPDLTNNGGYNSPYWQAITAFFSDVLTAIGNRNKTPDSSQFFINLQNQLVDANGQAQGLNYNELINLDSTYSTDVNSPYSLIQAIENRGWVVNMDGKG